MTVLTNLWPIVGSKDVNGHAITQIPPNYGLQISVDDLTDPNNGGPTFQVTTAAENGTHTYLTVVVGCNEDVNAQCTRTGKLLIYGDTSGTVICERDDLVAGQRYTFPICGVKEPTGYNVWLYHDGGAAGSYYSWLLIGTYTP